jgi:hypothetical protein
MKIKLYTLFLGFFFGANLFSQVTQVFEEWATADGTQHFFV